MTYEQWKDVAQFVVLPLLGYATYVVRNVREGIRKLNGRMIDMERWRTDHEKSDNEKHIENVARLGRIEGELISLRHTERNSR